MKINFNKYDLKVKYIYFNIIIQMNWLNILKKNNKEFENKQVEKENESVEENILYDNTFLTDVDEEFSVKYNNTIVDVKVEFEDYINDLSLPFLNNKDLFIDYNFYDFIKDNSENFQKIIENSFKEEEEYAKKIEEEEKYYEENSDNIFFYDK